MLLDLVRRMVETGEGPGRLAAGTDASAGALKRFVLHLSSALGLVDADGYPLVNEKNLRQYFRRSGR